MVTLLSGIRNRDQVIKHELILCCVLTWKNTQRNQRNKCFLVTKQLIKRKGMMEIRKPSVKRDRGSPVIVPSTTRQKISWHKKLQSVTLIAMGLREGGSTYDYEYISALVTFNR